MSDHLDETHEAQTPLLTSCSQRRRATLAAGISVGTLVLASCSSDDRSPAASNESSTTSTTAAGIPAKATRLVIEDRTYTVDAPVVCGPVEDNFGISSQQAAADDTALDTILGVELTGAAETADVYTAYLQVEQVTLLAGPFHLPDEVPPTARKVGNTYTIAGLAKDVASGADQAVRKTFELEITCP